jgi:hypothetical protein
MNVERLTAILKGKIRTNASVFKMLTDCYRKGALPCMDAATELTPYSSVVSVVHEAILLQVHAPFNFTTVDISKNAFEIVLPLMSFRTVLWS